MNRPVTHQLASLALTLFVLTGESPAQLYQYHASNLRTISIGTEIEYLVGHSLRCFENAYAFETSLYDWKPSERVTLFIQDLRDYGNAAALTVPRCLISLSVAPYSYVYETSPANERINSTMNHELVHLATLDKPAGSDRFFRRLFLGKPAPVAENPLSVLYRYLTSPRWSSPRWYIEGIAVFIETWNAGGLGRAQGAYDEMVFRTSVSEGRRLYDVLAVEAEGTAIDFQAGALSYMYGTRFMSSLAYEHGPMSLIRWTGRQEDGKAYFATQFEHVYGVPLADGWSTWIRSEEQWQEDNLRLIREHPVTRDRALSSRPLGSVSRGFLDPSGTRLYAAIRYPGQVASLAAIDVSDGSVRLLEDVKGAALYYTSSTAFDSSTGAIFYTTDNNDWRDIAVFNVRTGESRRVMEDTRIGDLAFNHADRSLWGVRHDNGFSTIVRIPSPYNEWNQVWTLPYGKDLFDLDFSADGELLVAGMTEVNGQQKLILFEVDRLRNGETSFDVLFDFDFSTPSNFIFSPDGEHLFGSSYYTGVSNLFRYSFQTRQMDILTNAETGYFRPLPVAGDSLIAFRYSGDGFVPVKLAIEARDNVNAIRYFGNAIVEKHPDLRDWKLQPPSAATVDSTSLLATEYSPVGNISLASAYPVVEGYKDFVALGWRFNFSDKILLHDMNLTLSYSPNRQLPVGERFHVSFFHSFWEWTIRAGYNSGGFYDLFGPTKVTRKGYYGSLQYKRYLIYDDPKTLDYRLTLAAYGGLERLPEFQNVTASFDKLITFRGQLTYQYFNRSIGAVDDEKGTRWQVTSWNNYVRSRLFPRLSANLDYGIALPLDHSSIWLRTAAGVSSGDRSEPFANFFFGGFGNNWIDYQDARRYREDFSFPGIGINDAGGTTFGKIMLEWTLPPVRFRNVGSPGFYSNWMRFAVFSSMLTTNPDKPQFRTTFGNVGSQLDFRISFLSSFESTLSLGIALAAEKDHRFTREFMLSLKILK